MDETRDFVIHGSDDRESLFVAICPKCKQACGLPGFKEELLALQTPDPETGWAMHDCRHSCGTPVLTYMRLDLTDPIVVLAVTELLRAQQGVPEEEWDA